MAPQFETLSGAPQTRIIVDKPMDAMVSLLARFHRSEPRAEGVHPTAAVARTATIGTGVTIDPHAVIGEHVVIGDGCWIGANSTVGAGSTLGRDVRLHANATVYPFTELGDRVVLHSGARVDAKDSDSCRKYWPGAHSARSAASSSTMWRSAPTAAVDRGSVDDTIIGAGTKIDNLVQIGHNVRMGRMCFCAAQVGVAGSTRIEDGVQLGGRRVSAGI